MEELINQPLGDIETSIELDELCAIYRPYQRKFDPESVKDIDDVCYIYLHDDDAVSGFAHAPLIEQTGLSLPSENQVDCPSTVDPKKSTQNASEQRSDRWQSTWTAQKLLNNRQGQGFRQLVELTVNKYDGLTSRLFDRFGTCKLASELIYEGPFDEKRSATGVGRLIFPDGTIFDGQIKDGSVGCRGIYRWPNGSFYEGNLQSGLRNGYGRLYDTTNGSFYCGNWLASHQHGYGKIIYHCRSSSFYQGQWYIGVPWGYGIRQWPSGNFFEGQWAKGLPHGQGTKFWLMSNVYYRGEFEEGKPQGYGLMIWLSRKSPSVITTNQKCYYGMFQQGYIHGYGVYCSEDGVRHWGDWKKGMKHGRFRIFFGNGAILECSFVNNVPFDSMPKYLLKESKEKFYVVPLPAPNIAALNFRAQSISNELTAFAIPGTVHFLSQIIGLTDNTVTEECMGIALVVKSHQESLTDVYNAYNRLLVDTACDNIYTMRSLQFWQFLIDVVFDPTTSSTEVQHSMYSIITRIEECFENGAKRGLFCHPYLPISFQEFLDRIAIAAYLIELDKQSVTTRRENKTSTAAGFKKYWDIAGTPLTKIIETKIFKNAGLFRGNMFDDPKKCPVLFRYVSRLHRIYQYIYEFYGGQAEVHPDALTLEMICSALQDCHIIDTTKMSLKTFFDLCVKSYPQIRENPKTSVSLCIPVTFLEFFGLILEVALRFATDIDRKVERRRILLSDRYTYKGKITEAVDSVFLTGAKKPELATEKKNDEIDFDPNFFATLRGDLVTDNFFTIADNFYHRMTLARNKYNKCNEYVGGDRGLVKQDLLVDEKLKGHFNPPIFPPPNTKTLEKIPEDQLDKQEFIGLSVTQHSTVDEKGKFCFQRSTGAPVCIPKSTVDGGSDLPQAFLVEAVSGDASDGWKSSVVNFLELEFLPAMVMLKRTNDMLISHGHVRQLRSASQRTDVIEPLIRKILDEYKTNDCLSENDQSYQN